MCVIQTQGLLESFDLSRKVKEDFHEVITLSCKSASGELNKQRKKMEELKRACVQRPWVGKSM